MVTVYIGKYSVVSSCMHANRVLDRVAPLGSPAAKNNPANAIATWQLV